MKLVICTKFQVNRMNCVESRGGSDWSPPTSRFRVTIFPSRLLGLTSLISMQLPQIMGSVSSRCLGMSPRSPPERRLGAWGWALVTDVSSQMYMFDGDSCSRASNLADFMQWRNIVSKPDLVKGVFWILWKLVFKSWTNMKDCSPKSAKSRLATWTPSHWHACLFVYCGSEENYGFVSCCCTKSRTSPKLKTFFHWYVFYLLAFR